jgi:hypothetical protein
MIDYQEDPSPFFQKNKKYCRAIEDSLRGIKVDYTGFCDCYGYEVRAVFERGSLTYTFTCIKNQDTTGITLIPLNANDYAGIDVRIKGLGAETHLSIGQSVLLRLFSSRGWKALLPSPYYAFCKSASGKEPDKNLINAILLHKIGFLYLDKGQMHFKIHEPAANPLSLVLGLEKIFLQI